MDEMKAKDGTKKVTKRPLVLAGVILASFMSAIEGTIVSTAMPAISGELGDFSLYSWVFSSYLLTVTITVLIYGKLADLFGRKLVINIGICIFLVGSLLCGLATTMPMLILFRFVQGVGGGALASVATTIIGDIYQNEERGKVQGYLSSVWGISAVLGPLIGGLLVEYVSWQYVFWLNIPLGIASFFLFFFFLHEDIDKENRHVDYFGAILLMITVSTLMILFVDGGVGFDWVSWQSMTLIALSLFCLFFFIVRGRESPHSIIPFKLWKEKSIVIANLVSFTTGIILIGISSYLPAFVQGVMGKTPIIAGFTLTTMSIGWPIASTLAGRWVFTVGYKKVAMFGGLSLIVGSMIFITMTPQLGPVWAACGSLFIGAGLGFTTTAFIVSIQTLVSWKERGIATALFTFMRNLGNALGAALLGGILNSRLYYYFQQHEHESDGELSINSVNQLLNNDDPSLTEHQYQLIQDGLTFSLHTVYIIVGIFALVSVFAILLYPNSAKKYV